MDSDFKIPTSIPIKDEPADNPVEPVMTEDHSPVEDQPHEEVVAEATPEVTPTEEESMGPVMGEDHSPAEDQPHEEVVAEATPAEEESMGPVMTEEHSPVEDQPHEEVVTEATPEVTPAEEESDVSSQDGSVESHSIVTQPMVEGPVKIKNAHKFIYGYVGLIVLVVIVAGVYVWQHDKVSTLNQQLVVADSALSSEQKQVTSLEAKLAKATVTPTLGLSVIKAVRYTPKGATTPNTGVAVDVSITNSSSSAFNLVTSAFKLKDAKNNSYVATNFPTQTTDSSLPTGYSLLIDQSVPSTFIAQGTLEFTVSNTALTSFTLVYGSQSIPVTLN
jgi:hypothetical protein